MAYVLNSPVLFGEDPNIQGGVGAKGGVAWQEGFGCFEVGGELADVVISSNTEQSNRSLYMYASNSSSIYGGTAMQPKALSCLPCIKF